jgi:hypothetical protein
MAAPLTAATNPPPDGSEQGPCPDGSRYWGMTVPCCSKPATAICHPEGTTPEQAARLPQPSNATAPTVGASVHVAYDLWGRDDDLGGPPSRTVGGGAWALDVRPGLKSGRISKAVKRTTMTGPDGVVTVAEQTL